MQFNGFLQLWVDLDHPSIWKPSSPGSKVTRFITAINPTIYKPALWPLEISHTCKILMGAHQVRALFFQYMWQLGWRVPIKTNNPLVTKQWICLLLSKQISRNRKLSLQSNTLPGLLEMTLNMLSKIPSRWCQEKKTIISVKCFTMQNNS